MNRRKTRSVRVGTVRIGSEYPVRMQSMTTTATRDIEGTVDQVLRLEQSGCEIVRVTVQGIKEAEACEKIKNQLLQKQCHIPLVADIHFYPPAALRVVEFVDKVRINPGNFADKRANFQQVEYTQERYLAELQRVEEKFSPLVEKCKELDRALRIGTNHGSLSDRILNRFGDTPEGMVESAFEYAHICRKLNYHNFLFSMKSSNPKVMVAAYRLLVQRMDVLGWDYPLHLGVTEAGAGEEGRVKSAIGMGALLLEGIGDTIRVSLTEDPWLETDPCRRLIAFASQEAHGIPHASFPLLRKPSSYVHPLHRDGSVFLQKEAEEPVEGIVAPSAIEPISLSLLEKEHRLQRYAWVEKHTPVRVQDESEEEWEVLRTHPPPYLFFAPSKERVVRTRRFFSWLEKNSLSIPVILNFSYTCSPEDLLIFASAECGALLIDGLGDGLLIEGDCDANFLRNLSFTILQGARMRVTKTEFISCPSCGRTLFDLQEVTARIQKRTEHLVGVKIAIMGCIVNGPGEMADADFGYVGSKPGKVDLYVGKSCVEKNIDFSDADERLIALIQSEGRWVEPS